MSYKHYVYVDFKRYKNDIGVQIYFGYGIDGFDELRTIIKSCGGAWDKSLTKWVVKGVFAFYCVDIIDSLDNYHLIYSDYFKYFLRTEMKKLERNVRLSSAKKPTYKINVPVVDGKKYFEFQKAAVEFFENRGRSILLADDMGCIAGDAIININRGGKGYPISLRDAYNRFNGFDRKNWNWDKNIPTYARSLCGDELRLNLVKNIIHTGIKPVVKITLLSGKTIKLTEDHEVLNNNGDWIKASKLTIGDMIMTNGDAICPECGSSDDIITYEYAKFCGFCKKCVYKFLRKNGNGNFWIYSYIDKDGYVKVRCPNHPRVDIHGFVYQHILIMEKMIGRYIDYEIEEIHHKNRKRCDNREENLELLLKDDHRLIHANSDKIYLRLREYFIPKIDVVKSVEYCGEIDVYDIVMDDPYRNFVANGIIVHNCGKTISAIAIANYNKYKRVLIICPESAKDKVWLESLNSWYVGDSSIYVVTAGKKYNDSADIIIINYDLLKKHHKSLIEKDFEFLIADEAHMLKNTSASRTKIFKKIASTIKSKILLTGTPILNKPIELFSLVQLTAGNPFGSKVNYAFRHCDAKLVDLNERDKDKKDKKKKIYLDADGYSNLNELNFKLRSTVMMRREKSDVIDEFPNVTREIVQLDSTYADEIDKKYKLERKRYKDELSELKKNKNKYYDFREYSRVVKSTHRYHFDQISLIRRELGINKTPDIIKFVNELLNNGVKKLVLFVHHREVVDELHRVFSGQSVVIYGGMTSHQKAKSINKFEQDDNIKVFIGSIQASGVAYTLTVSHTVVFGELDWTPSMVNQAECRCIRLGQKNDVSIYYLIVNNSLDLNMLNKIHRKTKVIKTVMI